MSWLPELNKMCPVIMSESLHTLGFLMGEGGGGGGVCSDEGSVL